jgi:hypothetical protein
VNESVSLASESLKVLRLLNPIVQRNPYLAGSRVQTLIHLNINIWPKDMRHLLARNHFAWVLKQGRKELKRLAL